MSEPKLISPLLDNFIMGGSISSHHGVQCYPAMQNDTDDKYIIKVISIPATPTQMDALLLTGAYPDEESALIYFKQLADDVIREVDTLKNLSELEGFLPYAGSQVVPMDSGKGYEIYLLSSYKRNLEKHFKRHVMTHLDALNLGLDLCAALSVCRRSGYLYVNLKPGNVFVTGDHLYRIGDLGFIRLDSLKYASLPEKYLSVYTPPEITDAFSSLNTTMDIYATGLILYQAYNNGTLPFNDEIVPGDALPSPAYADYEMSEIILKACAANPDDRWQDPMEMGQAIINYMQKNGAMDTPIVPASVPVYSQPKAATPEPTQEELTTDQELPADTLEIETEPESDLDLAEIDSLISLETEDSTEDTEESEETGEDSFENLSFLSDIDYNEDESDNETDYEAISDEVSEILNQVDELAALEVPEPVVAPEYIDVPIPEPEPPEPEEEPAPEGQDSNSETEQPSDQSIAEETPETQDAAPLPKKKRHWIRNSILIILLLALLTGGYYYYQNYYLLPIESIQVDGTEDSLTVLVKTEIDESLLQVICSDTYGNQIPSPVKDGKAVFTDLIPDTAYTIKVVSTGFHQVTGSTATAYSTPVQSNIVQFDAVTGSSDGSVILSFTVEGPDCQEWNVFYSAEGEEEKVITFSSHMITLSDLIIGKEYTFRLMPSQELYLSGQNEITYTPKKIVKAEALEITGCANNVLTAVWSVQDNQTVESWSVRCFNETYSETIITTDTFAQFQVPDNDAAYSVEVKAAGMSVSQMVSIPANSVTAANFNINTSNPTALDISWESSKEIPESGWFLHYSIDGIDEMFIVECHKNSAAISSIIPNATYRIHLEDGSGNILLGSSTQVTTGDSVPFDWSYDGYDVHTDDLIFSMCKTPNVANWDRYDLKTSDYTTEFSVGEAASFLVKITRVYSTSSETVIISYVIRNAQGQPIQTDVTSVPWRSMWYRNYCELDIPIMPSAVGDYTMEVYFNGGLVVSQPFTIK